MYDRPNAQELLDAARIHLEQNVVPAIRSDPKLYFQTLVTINVLKIVGREIALGANHAATEWAGLNMVTEEEIAPPASLSDIQAAIKERNIQLCIAIRHGDYDTADKAQILFQHLKMTTVAQLEVANPKFLQTVMSEQ
jgi:hypothetical protein